MSRARRAGAGAGGGRHEALDAARHRAWAARGVRCSRCCCGASSIPNVAIIVGSFEHGLGDWREFAASPADREALWTTLVVAIGSVIGALRVGVPLAFLLRRVEFRGRRLLQRGGDAAGGAAAARRRDRVSLSLRRERCRHASRAARCSAWPKRRGRLTGVWRDHLRPRVHDVRLRLPVRVRRARATRRDARRSRGGARRVDARFALRQVTLPLLTPALAGSMLLVFMSALGSFSAPYIFGGGLRVLSTQILASKLNGAMGLAYVETTVLALARGRRAAPAPLARAPPHVRARGEGRATRGSRCAAPLARVRAAARRGARVRARAAARDGRARLLRARRRVDDAGAAAGVHARQLPAPRHATRSSGADHATACAMAVLATVANVVVCFVAAYLLVAPTLRRDAGCSQLLVALPWAIPATAIALGLAATFDRNDAGAAARCCSSGRSGFCRSRTSSATSRS